jgi:GTP-binding protein
MMHNGQGFVSGIALDNIQHQNLARWRSFAVGTTTLSTTLHSSHTTKKTINRQNALPTICFLGRSNVGKSSILNALTKSEVAVVGKTPGATRAVNVYTVRKEGDGARDVLNFVDLPGFGYAKLSRSVQGDLSRISEHYITTNNCVALCVLLIDSRREVTEEDMVALEAMYEMDIPVVVVGTKSDKLGVTASKEDPGKAIRDGLGLPDGLPLMVSSVTGSNVKQLWKIIMDAAESLVDEVKSGEFRGASAEEDEARRRGEMEGDGEELGYAQQFEWRDDWTAPASTEVAVNGGKFYGKEGQKEGGEGEGELAAEGAPKLKPQSNKITLRSALDRLKLIEKKGSVPFFSK